MIQLHHEFWRIQTITSNRGTFYRVDIQDGTYFWVHPLLVGDHIALPLKDARWRKTEKGTLILEPAHGSTAYLLVAKCGYRGESSVSVEGGEVVHEFSILHSPRGRLGRSAAALVNASGEFTVEWRRSGRLYGDPPAGKSVIREGGVVDAPPADAPGMAGEVDA